MTRGYEITDEGDEIHFALFQDGEHVGGGIFPCLDDGEAFNDALELCQAWESGETDEPPEERERRLVQLVLEPVSSVGANK